ncbi:MAG: hypothetical protein AAGM38_01755 [Pseudomonadota bacterium]
MDRLSAAIERFEAAADRVERSGVKALKRAAAQADGGRAQGRIIEQLRLELKTLRAGSQAPAEAASPQGEEAGR